MAKEMYRVRNSKLRDWIVDKTAARPSTWAFILKVFKLIVKGSKLAKYPVVGPMYKWLMMFSPVENRYTHTVIFDLNVDLTDKASDSVVVPIDFMKQAIKDAGFRASMNKCICRDASHCKDYPTDICCIFVGEGAQVLIDRKLGYEISLEDAMARVDQAAELGLIGSALWIEVEQFIWGIKNEHMNRWLEFCFCCPCCCVAFNAVKNATREMQDRFQSIGWQARVNENCNGCGNCVEVCPQQAISLVNGQAEIAEYCFGCGLCKTKCALNAIRVELVKPMKDRVVDYFREDGLLELNLY